MNQFSELDQFFPCLPNRKAGEVVGIDVQVYTAKGFTFSFFERHGCISWKRKAWYVNASVNAFHLHRGLCRELRELVLYKQLDISTADMRMCTKLLAVAVRNAYLVNHFTNEQGYNFALSLGSGRGQEGSCPSLYATTYDGDYLGELSLTGYLDTASIIKRRAPQWLEYGYAWCKR